MNNPYRDYKSVGVGSSCLFYRYNLPCVCSPSNSAEKIRQKKVKQGAVLSGVAGPEKDPVVSHRNC